MTFYPLEDQVIALEIGYRYTVILLQKKNMEIT